nr:8-amino-7-oxononanoate synthase [uncultured Rhodoferax sp.]
MSVLDSLAEEIQALDAAKLLRVRRSVEAVQGAHLLVNGRDMLAFCGNDYLGLSQHPEVVVAAQQAAAHWGVGATASPLVCGHSASHGSLESELAEFLGLPRALYFASGFTANVGLVPTLVGRDDAVFCDALNHASLIDGARLSRAQIGVFPHSDLQALENQLQVCTARRKLIVTDAVFSMDGDISDLPALLRLAEQYDALLLVDDAHGFGVLGKGGRGIAEHAGVQSPRLIIMGTLSKAAGSAGAFVAGDARVVELVMQRARSYIFATTSPAMVTEALRASLRVIQREGWRRQRVQTHAARLRAALADRADVGRLLPSITPIQPLVIGENTKALERMAKLWEQGIWVPAIRPPTVPVGTARLRISLSAAHSEADIERLIAALLPA